MWFLGVFLIGFVAGLRALLAPTAASWAARTGILAVAGTPFAFMGFRYTPLIFTILAIAEIINDKLPSAGSRKAPPAFVARIMTGALAGATVAAAGHGLVLGILVGAIGAASGTLGGAAGRAKLAAIFGRDLPAALLEDVAGIAIAAFSVLWLG
jgi:uncharacterized membrane protein